MCTSPGDYWYVAVHMQTPRLCPMHAEAPMGQIASYLRHISAPTNLLQSQRCTVCMAPCSMQERLADLADSTAETALLPIQVGNAGPRPLSPAPARQN